MRRPAPSSLIQFSRGFLLSALLLSYPGRALADLIIPPIDDRPSGTAPAGRRGSECFSNQLRPVGLLPQAKIGLTLAAHPTLFFYIPTTTAQNAEFVLRNENNQPVYKTLLKLTGKPGVMAFSLPETTGSPSLDVGKGYQWSLAVICDAQNRAKDEQISGFIYRIAPDPGFDQKLNRANVRDRPDLYAQAGIWHDALRTLADLRRSNPKDAQLVDDWTKLLQSAGLGRVASAPLVQP